MGRGSSKAGGGSGNTFNPGGYTGADKTFIEGLARDYNSGDLYGGDMQAAVEAYTIGTNLNDDDMINAVRTRAAMMSFNGNSNIGASASGKPYDAKDYTTWKVGDKVSYTTKEGGRSRTVVGDITSVRSSDNNVLVSADGMNLIIDSDTKSKFKPKK